MGGVDRTKDWDRVIMHVDMDAFFAAFEIRNVPHLKGKPVIIGGDPRFRSVVTTCSYEARRYGVHSGMSVAQAKRLCPHGIYISGTLKGYVYTATVLISIFEKYSPIVEPFSVDEACLDITGCHRIFGTVENLVDKLKKEIRENLSLTCSVGISPTKLLAKMASGENKPDGMTVMDRNDFKRMFYPRPVDALWGIGDKTKEALKKIGVITVEDLAGKKEKELSACFGRNGDGLYVLAHGLDTSDVYSIDNRPNEKSMSHETTLAKDLRDIEQVYSTMLWLSDKVSRRLRRGGYVGRTVSVKVRSKDFKTITRDYSLSCPTDQCKTIYDTARKLIPREYGTRIPIRLLGVKVSHLRKKHDDIQFDLLDDKYLTKLTLSSLAVDRIRDRYGESLIKYAGTRF
ncbi:MAG: DNA polymerase IV [Candidatus Zixiibacteriota bacterium]|nr:MAG: DNA polymerase IV [candidate division Zixibacteria bacterium]